VIRRKIVIAAAATVRISREPKFLGATTIDINLTIDRPKLSPEDEKRLMMESQRNNHASE
jgi:hypothetical protein